MLAVLLPAAPAHVAVAPVLAMQAPVGEWVVQAATRAAPDFKALVLVAWACGALAGLLVMALQQDPRAERVSDYRRKLSMALN